MTDEFSEENADQLAEELMGSLEKLFETDQVADDQRLIAKDPRGPWCSHKRVRLTGESRRVICRDCDREVSAYDALDSIAHDWERHMHGRRDAQKRAKTAEANLIELLRLERNAKGRLRNAAKKAPRCSCTEDQRTADTVRLERFWRGELEWCPRCGGRW